MKPTLAQLKKQIADLDPAIYRELIAGHEDRIKVKPETACKNLAKIVEATLAVANAKGFQAMSLRDLSAETEMSMGGLYAYIRSKDDLVQLIQRHGQLMAARVLEQHVEREARPGEQLAQLIRAHVLLSELLRPWFYFSYMEAKNLPEKEKRDAVASELSVDEWLRRLIEQGMVQGDFQSVNAALVSALIKAMLQDWYLKRGKYKQRKISVEDYIVSVQGFVLRALAP
jgi:AcrR family transcriptional regulator